MSEQAPVHPGPSNSPAGPTVIGVLSVDDNSLVADALRIKFARCPDIEWRGWLSSAENLVETVRRTSPHIVLLDVDMPGPDPFAAAAEVFKCCPQTRIVVFSSHVRGDLVDTALDSGAWAYVAKSDGEDAILDAVRRVAAGEFVLSPEVRAVCHQR